MSTWLRILATILIATTSLALFLPATIEAKAQPAGLQPFKKPIFPPFDSCVASANPSKTSPTNSVVILQQGFSAAEASCDPQRGSINYSVVVFGGRQGNIFEPPSQEASAFGEMGFEFISPLNGTLKIEAKFSVNGRTGAAAGSDTALPDFLGIVESFLPSMIGAFIDIAKAVIWQSAAGVRTDAYLTVDTATSKREATSLVGGHGFVASFPLPPWSQNGRFSSEEVVLSLSIPVTVGESIHVTSGIRTEARAHGWAEAHWNHLRSEESFVSVVLSAEEEGAPTEPSIVIPDIQRPDGSGLLVTTTVTVPGAESPLDLIFVIDTTGSMTDDIDQVKAQATELADQIAADVADYRLGLVTYRDHPVLPYGDPGDQPSTVVLPFTTDADAAIAAIQGLIVGGGADRSESVYSGLMAAIDQAWRDGAEKAIILLGDAPPHDPEPFTGYTLDQVLVAAYAVDPANIYPILVGSDPDAAAYFAALAEGSEGQLFAAGDADEVVDALLQALQKIAETRAETVVAFPPPPPMPLCSDIGGLQNTFVRAAIPEGAAGSAMVFCRPLVQNRQYIFTGSAAQIGNADALSLGIIHAVDVYTYDPTGATHRFFDTPVHVCLQGTGDLYILGASQSPRALSHIDTAFVDPDGFTCGVLGEPGTLMLVDSRTNNPTNPSVVGSGCTLTATHNLNLRSEPNTSSEVLAVLPFNTSMQGLEQVQGWFHVQTDMGEGWVSADYVVPSATCNP